MSFVLFLVLIVFVLIFEIKKFNLAYTHIFGGGQTIKNIDNIN
jgi:flagellar biogenesis protein FliO